MTLYNEFASEIFNNAGWFARHTSDLPTVHYCRQCYFYITSDTLKHGDIVNFTERKIIPNHQYLRRAGNKQFTIYKLIGVADNSYNVYICIPIDKTALKNRANIISIQTPDCIAKYKSKIDSLEQEKQQCKSKDKKYKSIYLQLRELHGRLGFAEMLWKL